MINSLIILSSTNIGSRDLWWTDDPEATKGYNIYRAFDYPVNWEKLNETPWLGHFYRDQVSYELVEFTVQDSDWLEKGEFGKWGFKLPDIPYSSVVQGRPVIANNPDDVQVTIDGTQYRPVQVVGIDQSVWLQMDRQLPMGGAVSAFPALPDMTTVNEVKVAFKKLKNHVDVYSTLVRSYYTVVPVGDGGEVHQPGVLGSKVISSEDIESLNWIWAEAIRRNGFLFEQVGEPAFILFKRSRGKICGCVKAQQEGRTACPVCFGVGYVGGYYGPYDIVYLPPDTALQVELNEGGRKVTRISRSYLGPTPRVQNGDIIIRENGDRLVISDVNHTAPQGCVVQQDFATELLTFGDTRYLIPLSPALPTLYNPVVRGNPMDGGKGNGQPLFDARVPMKDKEPWENKVQTPVGRTVTFGKITT